MCEPPSLQHRGNHHGQQTPALGRAGNYCKTPLSDKSLAPLPPLFFHLSARKNCRHTMQENQHPPRAGEKNRLLTEPSPAWPRHCCSCFTLKSRARKHRSVVLVGLRVVPSSHLLCTTHCGWDRSRRLQTLSHAGKSPQEKLSACDVEPSSSEPWDLDTSAFPSPFTITYYFTAVVPKNVPTPQ